MRKPCDCVGTAQSDYACSVSRPGPAAGRIDRVRVKAAASHFWTESRGIMHKLHLYSLYAGKPGKSCTQSHFSSSASLHKESLFSTLCGMVCALFSDRRMYLYRI